jgi:hypothetical protein
VPAVSRPARIVSGFEHDDLGLTGSDIAGKLNAKLAILGNLNFESMCVHGHVPRLWCAAEEPFATAGSLPDYALV